MADTKKQSLDTALKQIESQFGLLHFKLLQNVKKQEEVQLL